MCGIELKVRKMRIQKTRAVPRRDSQNPDFLEEKFKKLKIKNLNP